MDWQSFFAMGGYAFEVWTCWGLSLLTLLGFIIHYKHKNAKIRRELLRQIQREQKLKENISSS